MTIELHDARFLHRHAAYGYTANPAMAARSEPEALTAEEQNAITADAERNAGDQRRAALEEASARLRREAEYHAAQLRHRERQLARINRRLANAQPVV